VTLTARGSLSEALLHALRGTAADRADLFAVSEDGHEDAQLSLWMLYELHYGGLEGVDDVLEWDPDLLRLRRRLEADLERRLRGRFPGHRHEGRFADALFEYIDAYDGPALAPYVQRSADEEQVRELLKHRSLYHLKEFDPSAWVVPRLGTVPKAGLIELAYDEYGVGDPDRLHAHLFARGMAASGLDPSRWAYVDEAPPEILEQNNAMSLLGLHRRLRAAALGHLAAFEATSSGPSRRLALGLQRLGFDDRMVGYYTEHVTADAVHDQLACRGVCGSFVEEEPEQAEEVFFGAFSCLDLEARYAARMLEDWQGPPEEATA
jgi:hypothetical protein